MFRVTGVQTCALPISASETLHETGMAALECATATRRRWFMETADGSLGL
jgi:hypothetical protein